MPEETQLEAGDKQEGYEELPEAEVTDPSFKQVLLTPEEADLYGTALMNLITSGLALGNGIIRDHDRELIELTEDQLKSLSNVVFWAAEMQSLVERKAAEAGLGMIP